MAIGAVGTAGNGMAVMNKAGKLRQRVSELEEKRARHNKGMEDLDQFAPGSPERKAMANLHSAGLEAANFEMAEIVKAKAELRRVEREGNSADAADTLTEKLAVDKAEDAEAAGEPGETLSVEESLAAAGKHESAEFQGAEQSGLGQVVDVEA